MTAIERFYDKVWILEDGCHLWTASLGGGYGLFWFEGKYWSAHRWIWLQTYGSLPPAPLELDHLCRKRACVNVVDLEPVTRTVNHLRGDPPRSDLTKCQKGLHDWVPENLVLRPNDTPTCRPCRAETMARYYGRREVVDA